jgi:anhydro-N-acetylmuramic acid kinase
MAQSSHPPLRTIGCISGTSMDAIDVAFLETDGENHLHPGASAEYPYPAALQATLRAIIADPARAADDPLQDVEAAVTTAFSEAITAFIHEFHLDKRQIDLIGFHGQTVFHAPARRLTRQLGDGAMMVARFGIPVVNRFREADVLAGGQGAPLVPLYHAALAAALPKPLMVLNLGGVGNVTYLGAAGEIIAFDTGPASALMDDEMLRRYGKAYDAGGHIAASGHVDESALAALMAHPYFAVPPPKSLDRNAFHDAARITAALSPADALATLNAFTCHACAAALRHVESPPLRWLVAGGGRLNNTLMSGLATLVSVPVDPVEAVGWNGDALEAQCFGYLAVRSLRGLPLSLPTTTGVPEAMTGGMVWKV